MNHKPPPLCPSNFNCKYCTFIDNNNLIAHVINNSNTPNTPNTPNFNNEQVLPLNDQLTRHAPTHNELAKSLIIPINKVIELYHPAYEASCLLCYYNPEYKRFHPRLCNKNNANICWRCCKRTSILCDHHQPSSTSNCCNVCSLPSSFHGLSVLPDLNQCKLITKSYHPIRAILLNRSDFDITNLKNDITSLQYISQACEPF